MLRRFSGNRLAVLVLLALGTPPTLAQPPAPPPPKEYRVWLRYQLRTTPPERPGHFFNLVDALEDLGFNKAPGPEGEEGDPRADRLTGTVAATNARNLLRDRRVQALVLAPVGYKRPEDPETPVKVQLELLPGLSLRQQHALVGQVRPWLVALGFRDAIGYDDRAYTRLVGTVPSGKLDLLLQDLRWQTTGWFAPELPVAQLPLPLRERWPLVVTEIIPEPADVPPAKDVPTPPPVEEHLQKLTPEVRALVTDEAENARPVRLEVLLAGNPPEDTLGWERLLTKAASAVRVEGRLGQVVTILARPEHAVQLAQASAVASVRMPRIAQLLTGSQPGTREQERDLLLENGLERLHNLGYRGQGVRVAVVDSDFRGFAALTGKQLPAKTRMIDLTATRNPDLTPDPMAGDPQLVGRGTQAALAVARAAPAAELILVRVDPATPYMVRDAARYFQGEPFRSLSLAQRSEELLADTERIAQRWDGLNADRQAVLNSFGQDAASVKRRAEFHRKEQELTRDEAVLDARRTRYLQLRRDLQALQGVHVVSSNLVWAAGYPVDGGGPLTSYFDDAPLGPLWLQAAGGTRGQVWADRFEDNDGDGVMEFAPAGTPLRPRRWTHELNFLGWNASGELKPELPADARVRVSVQWREPHADEFLRRGEDLYRRPLANLRLLVLRQRDPAGQKLPADALEIVGRSVDLPQRLVNEPGFAIYEQTVEFTVAPAGSYALRIEGRQPEDVRPPHEPRLPSLRQSWVLRPRAYVEVLDEASARAGRPVFLDYRSDEGTLGMPAEARTLVTVAAATESGRPRPSTALGPVLNISLLAKPDVAAYDGWILETSGAKQDGRANLATPFAAGLTASVLSSGATPAALAEALAATPGALIRVPDTSAKRRN